MTPDPLHRVYGLRPGVVWTEVDGEVVAWVPDAASLHLLDAPAAMVFLLCDGRVSLAETAAEIALAVDAPAHTVAPQVRDLAETLAHKGLLRHAPTP